MTATKHPRLLIVLLTALFLSVACAEQKAPETSGSTSSNRSYQSYKKDGLSLQYPVSWKFVYDDPQGLYSDRAVAFDVNDSSRLTLYLFNESGKTPSDIADIFIRRLKLETKEHIKNYVKSSIAVSDYTGIMLSWTNAMLVPYSIEMKVLPIGSPPHRIFAVFDLTEEDIEQQSTHILPILESIQYEQ